MSRITGKRRWVRVVEIVALLAITALVLGSVVGQPIVLGYVETGSMAPTLEPGDGYVSVPIEIAGPIEQGDVVVFRAERLHGGGLTTHRVVGQTENGFITKGDANPSTDQAANEPAVKEAQIVAELLAVNGNVVVIPGVGTVVDTVGDGLVAVQRTVAEILGLSARFGTRDIAITLLGFSVALYLWDGLRTRTGPRTRPSGGRSRDTGVDQRLVLGGIAFLLIVGLTAAMVIPSGPVKYGFVSSGHDTPGPSVIGAGQTETTTHVVSNAGVIPVVVFFETAEPGLEMTPGEITVAPRARANATVAITAPPQTGYYRRFLVEHRYLLVLPVSIIRSLYSIHPWLPIAAIDALIALPYYLLGVRLIGDSRIRLRTRELPPLHRLRRTVRRWY